MLFLLNLPLHPYQTLPTHIVLCTQNIRMVVLGRLRTSSPKVNALDSHKLVRRVVLTRVRTEG